MSGTNWTADQQKIIDMRGCNILVSAAAGSGKTAVLVERIFQRIVDPKDPVDVDQFVVVTFTKAAAAEMKNRLRKRIETALEKEPDNEHLIRQEGLLASAHISTVHSFCTFVIQNYFHRIGLDPSFRQSTEAEVDLLRTEVWNRILEEEYEAGRPDFEDLADMSELNRRDDDLRTMVFQIYSKMMEQPFPLDFLDRMEAFLEVQTEEEWEKTDFVRQLLDYTKNVAEDILEEQRELLSLCFEPGFPSYYEPHLLELGECIDGIRNAESYDQCYRIFASYPRFKTMSKRKDETVEEDKRRYIVDRCKYCKDRVEELEKKFFAAPPSEHLQDLKDMSGKIQTLLRLAKRLHEEFVKEKRKRGIVDYNDLEQLALEILLRRDEDTGEYVRTEAAKELAMEFAEIMIDEYQDSNLVQDTLLHAVSRDGLPGENPNIFMVGDAKQSIYRFRGGCPELFATKLMKYSNEEGAPCLRIDLHRNFRSREVVLEGSNAVFENIMHQDIGGVEYDEDARLRAGLEFPEIEQKTADKIDVYAIISNQNPEAEGILIAQKIKEMVSGEMPLYLWKDEEYRPAQYRDVVILTLSHKQGQVYFDALAEAGIPVVMEHKRGFFDTREISLMVSMLQVIDNPHQDIPLAAVLLGPMFSFTEEELAKVRVENRSVDLFEALCRYDRADELYHHIQQFLDVLSRLRNKASYAAVAEIVQNIYEETGIYEAVMMMKDGVQRNANMDSLMALAREFEGTTYHGLYQFVRYLERVSEQKEEMGEVNLVGEEENVVRIMTIHKSKGLEFPICFVGGMGRKLRLNNLDFLTIRPEMAIAAPIVDNKRRTKKKNLYTAFLDYQNQLDDIGECMRKLYVAMTRAGEKLILVGCTQKTDSKKMDFAGREKAKNFFELVLPAVNVERELFELTQVYPEELLTDLEEEIRDEEHQRAVLYNFDTTVCYNKDLQEALCWMDAAEESQSASLPVKVSVSDLKIQSMEEKETGDFTILTHEETEDEMPVPAFVRQEKEIDSARQGAAYGTIWHQVMAVIDFSKTETKELIRDEVKRLVETGRLRKEDTMVLNYDRLYTFFSSPLGVAMRQAQKEGRLHREQPFVMGREASELFEDSTETDLVLVQGIIDGYFETEEGIVLMDYKTDSLKPGEEQKLVDRYSTQMDLYRKALEGMTGKRVKRCLLYSFSLGKEIECQEGK